MTVPTLEQRLAAHGDRMSPSAMRVAAYLVERPDRAVVATAAEIAEEAQTSVATVVRTVQTLGYAGLPELRRGIGDEWGARRDPRDTLQRRVSRVERNPTSVLDTVLDDAIKLLAETRATVDHDAFNDAVRLLQDARQILVIGWGPAGTTADYLALQLHRLGCHATSESRLGLSLADPLSALQSDDVIVLIAPLTHLPEIDVILDRVRAVGAASILVTELLGERLRAQADHVLSTASSRRRTASHTIGVAALLDALVLGVATAAPDQALTRWSAIKQLWVALGKDESMAGLDAVAPAELPDYRQADG